MQLYQPDDVRSILTKAPFFKACDEAQLDRLSAGAVLCHYPKGKILFLHEQKAEYAYVLNSGWVKLFRETLDGDQAVVDVLPAGHLFGDSAIFNDAVYPCGAEIVERAELVQLSLAAIRTEIQTDNHFALRMMDTMARIRRQQDREIEHRSLQTAPQRIGCFLLRLIEQKQEKGAVTLHLPYDKTLVASRLGMQPETFSRALARLKQETGLTIKGATIEISSLDGLARYSCGACSSEFPCKEK